MQTNYGSYKNTFKGNSSINFNKESVSNREKDINNSKDTNTGNNQLQSYVHQQNKKSSKNIKENQGNEVSVEEEKNLKIKTALYGSNKIENSSK